jgi:hypothetical protein
MVQLVSAPLRTTVPVGVPPAPVTVTLTGTGMPTVDEKPVRGEMMVVVLGPGVTVWLAVAEAAV